MTVKPSETQQQIIEYMRQGARLIVSQHMDGHWLYEVEAKDGELLKRITSRTFEALRDDGVIEPMSRKGYYKLTKEYKS